LYNIDVDQTAPIISSIGFGKLLRPTLTKMYDYNLLRDLEELVKLLREYNGDKERLVVLIMMVVDYFHEYKTNITLKKPILRSLILGVVGEVTHTNFRDENNNNVLRSSIQQTSHLYHTPLPGINEPINNNAYGGALPYEPVSNLSSPIGVTLVEEDGDVIIVDEKGDAADSKEHAKESDYRGCHPSNPGEQLATPKKTINEEIATVTVTLIKGRKK